MISLTKNKNKPKKNHHRYKTVVLSLERARRIVDNPDRIREVKSTNSIYKKMSLLNLRGLRLKHSKKLIGPQMILIRIKENKVMVSHRKHPMELLS